VATVRKAEPEPRTVRERPAKAASPARLPRWLAPVVASIATIGVISILLAMRGKSTTEANTQVDVSASPRTTRARTRRR
jgi:hypothetical protein